MSVAEMKLELISKIIALDDEATLRDIIEVLKTPEEETPFNLSSTDVDIKEQYEEVVHKLTQGL